MPIPTFTHDAVPDLFPLYDCRFLKLSSLRNWNIGYGTRDFSGNLVSENVMTGADTHSLFRAIYISYLSIALHYSFFISEIAFSV